MIIIISIIGTASIVASKTIFGEAKENALKQNEDPFKTEHNPLDDLNNRNE